MDIIYRAEDGTEFRDKSSAMAHECFCDKASWLTDSLKDVPIDPLTIEKILVNAVPIYRILHSVVRHVGMPIIKDEDDEEEDETEHPHRRRRR